VAAEGRQGVPAGVVSDGLPAHLGYLGLGSNVGERRAHLLAAVDSLPRHGVRVLASSRVYETEPIGLVLEQRDFLNACLRIETELDPEKLLHACKQVERVLGRRAGGVRHGPRVIDVDLLLLGKLEHGTAALTLPHPEIALRRFVLVPLLELEPELTMPDGRRLADALTALGPGQAVRETGPPLH